jgi:pimeloyl-ACP methyl ester carboxylesterase
VIPGASTARLNATFAAGVARLVIIRGTGHNTISDKAQYLDAMREAL